jgi:hypothetical protein
MRKRIFTGIVGLAVILLGLLFAAPAQAVPNTASSVSSTPIGAIDHDNDATTADVDLGGVLQTATCRDGGDIAYKITLKWNYLYVDAAGVTRASLSNLVISRAWDSRADDEGIDLHFDVYQNPPGTQPLVQIQHKLYDGLELIEGSGTARDHTVAFNPRNPISNPADSFLRIKVGTDNDGKTNCPWIYFIEPSGLKLNTAV